MCGFVGFTGDFKGKKKTLNAMLEAIAHRGPDDSKTFHDDYLNLGFRRLSIVDLKCGSQPIYNEDKTKLIVFNGEIYNYLELKTDLEERGYKFKTKSDTEVILLGYEEFGTNILNKLRGMWSFVIYDLKDNKLFGSRDYFGIKPFYYYETKDNNIMFGSEIKSFLEHPQFTPEVNQNVLGTYLNFGFVPGTNTMFRDVYKLPPGSYFEYSDGNMTITTYYSPVFKPDFTKSFDDWTNLISKTVKESVEFHKRGDVEIGSFLSSGVDSSYLAKLGNDVATTKTFSVGYAENQYSELPFAKEFAKRNGLENYSKEITSDMYFDIAKKVVYHLDEPLADPSCLSLYYVCQNASEHVKAAFSGEGSDELFAGYSPYRDSIRMDAYNKVPLPLRKIGALVGNLIPDKVFGKDFLVRGAKPIEQRYFQAGNFIFDQKELNKLLINNNSITPVEVVAPFYQGTQNLETVSRMQTIDLNVWSPGDILLKADKMSMANSLEVRCPFLDIEVLKVALQIPAKDKVTLSDTKISLRAAARLDIDEATAGKRKLGFPVPLRDWLKQDEYYKIIKQAINTDTAHKYFNIAHLNKLLEDHKSGKRDTYRRLWAVYIFLLWHEEFIKE